MLELLQPLFALICGQNPDHTWAPGGLALPCCERCLGLYAGGAVAAWMHWQARPRLTGRFLELHGLFLLLMVPFGFHWLPQEAALRTMTGVLFGFGVVTFLYLPLSRQLLTWGLGEGEKVDSPRLKRWNTPHSKRFAKCGRASDVAKPLECAASPRHYAMGLAVTLALAPLLGALGGKLAAYGLAGLAFCGAVVLALLVLANIAAVLGWIVRRLAGARNPAI